MSPNMGSSIYFIFFSNFYSLYLFFHKITHNHLIASGELTGMRTALEAGKNVDVAVIYTVHPLRSHS